MASDDNVQFYWVMLSVDIENEDRAIELLKEIIGLWVTVQGFSIAGCWSEQYKQATTKKKYKMDLGENLSKLQRINYKCIHCHVMYVLLYV